VDDDVPQLAEREAGIDDDAEALDALSAGAAASATEHLLAGDLNAARLN